MDRASPMARFANYPRLTALILGAIGATGFQPLSLWPLTLLAIAGWCGLIVREQRLRRVLAIGWCFGFGHFVVGSAWIAKAFQYQPDMPAWLGWVAVFGIALCLAVYPAIAGAIAWGQRRRTGGGAAVFAFSFAGAWIVTEWLRGWVIMGYPWNPLGAVLLGDFARPGLAALAPWLGTFALSGVVALLGAGMWAMAETFAQRPAARRRIGAGLLVAGGLLTAGMMLPPLEKQAQGTLPFTLVQPDVRQEALDDPTQFESQFQNIARLSLPQRPGTRRLVLWPESGLPDYLREGYPQMWYNETTFAGDPLIARRRVGRVIGPGSMLLTGAVDLEMGGRRVVGARNVVTALDATGRIRDGYAKAHLVPGGEYLPLRPLLEPLGLSRLVAGSIDFWPGPGPRSLDLGGWGKVGVQICFEIVFPGHVIDRNDRPDFLFNPSNDGWFGAWGPPQHLAQARLRAIEEGMPILRATTTGISAVIDGHGVVRQWIPMHRAARLDGIVPPPLPPTLFSRFGNALSLGWAVLLFVVSAIALRRSRG